MGVAWVFETNRSVKAIERVAEDAGAERRSGSFSVDSTPFKPSANFTNVISLVHSLHHSHFPFSTFTIAPASSDGPSKTPRAVSDHGFDLILNKLSEGLQPDSPGKFEITGTEFVLADFFIRVGAVTMGSSMSKGVIVEVEYAACDLVSQCLGLLTEMVDSLFPEGRNTRPLALFRIPDANIAQPYAPIDTLQQYLDLFCLMRKRSDQ